MTLAPFSSAQIVQLQKYGEHPQGDAHLRDVVHCTAENADHAIATYGDTTLKEARAAAESILLRVTPSAVARREHAESRVSERSLSPAGSAVGAKASAASNAHSPAELQIISRPTIKIQTTC